MVDYNELRKKFPAKTPGKAARAAKIKAIAREYERKRAELAASRPPVLKKGIVFYAVVVIGLLMVGSLVLSATGRGGRAFTSKAHIQATNSVEALAVALKLLDVREPDVRRQNRLGALRVRVRGNDDVKVAVAARDKRLLDPEQQRVEAVDRLANPEAEVG